MTNSADDHPRRRGRPTLEPEVWARVLPVLRDNIGRGKKYTVASVAQAVGLTPPAVSQWIHDTNRPDYTHALRALRHIKVDTAILGESVPMLTGDRLDTKAMADEAIELLMDTHGVDRPTAAAAMVGIKLEQPTVRGFYKEAVTRLEPQSERLTRSTLPPGLKAAATRKIEETAQKLSRFRSRKAAK